MQDNKHLQIKNLITQINESHHSDFYRMIWGNQHISFESIPLCSRADLLKTPLAQRRYVQGKGITKIIESPEGTFLIERTLDDLGRERYGDFLCKKPLVLFTDPQDALEKSLWFYEQDILPLIGESNNLTVAAFSAKSYEIDLLMSNQDMVKVFLPELINLYDTSLIKNVILVDKQFDIGVVQSLFPHFPSITCIFELPELGSIAESCPQKLAQGRLVFHELETSIIEEGEETILSKTILSPTPMIRYKTHLHTILSTASACSCGKKGFMFL